MEICGRDGRMLAARAEQKNGITKEDKNGVIPLTKKAPYKPDGSPQTKHALQQALICRGKKERHRSSEPSISATFLFFFSAQSASCIPISQLHPRLPHLLEHRLGPIVNCSRCEPGAFRCQFPVPFRFHF